MKPPGSNTGVRPPPPPSQNSSGGVRFDWYECTVDGHDDGREVLALALALGARPVAARARNGYASAQSLERGEDQLAIVYGSSARSGEVHVTVSGSACDEVVPVVRRLWPEHRVSRADSCLDFRATFEALDVQCLEALEGSRVYSMLIVNSEGGATRYFGATTSEVRVRVYKKSEQLMALDPHLASSVERGIVRAEVQVRPSKREGKAVVATMSAADLWGMSKWSGELAESVLSFAAERTSTYSRRSSEWVRIRHYLALQYGPAFARRRLQVGDVVARAELLELFELGTGPV